MSPALGSSTPGQINASPIPPTDSAFDISKGSRAASLSAADSLPEPVSSPYKRARASLPGGDEVQRADIGEIGDVLGRIQSAEKAQQSQQGQVTNTEPTAAAAKALPEPDEDEDL